MTRTEASFHASVAGARAAHAAKQSGGDPAHATALGTAAVGGKDIHGVRFTLPSAYSALAVPAITELMERHGIRIMQMQSDGLFLAAFHAPREVYRLAVVQADAEAAKKLVALANDIVLTLDTREAIDEAVAWCLDAFQRLNGVKKPSAPAPEAPPDPSTATASSNPSLITTAKEDQAGW